MTSPPQRFTLLTVLALVVVACSASGLPLPGMTGGHPVLRELVPV